MKWVTQKRVWIDKDTNDKLADMLKKTRGYIKKERLCSAIIYEWIMNGGSVKVGGIILDGGGAKVCCAWIPIEENLWENFIDLCHRNNFDINIGFRIALYNFRYLIDNDYGNLLKYFFE